MIQQFHFKFIYLKKVKTLTNNQDTETAKIHLQMNG